MIIEICMDTIKGNKIRKIISVTIIIVFIIMYFCLQCNFPQKKIYLFCLLKKEKKKGEKNKIRKILLIIIIIFIIIMYFCLKYKITKKKIYFFFLIKKKKKKGANDKK